MIFNSHAANFLLGQKLLLHLRLEGLFFVVWLEQNAIFAADGSIFQPSGLFSLHKGKSCSLYVHIVPHFLQWIRSYIRTTTSRALYANIQREILILSIHHQRQQIYAHTTRKTEQISSQHSV
jgi:hypothetical protein